VFKPVLPSLHCNGGLEDCQLWMIECRGGMTPDAVADLPENRLATPVEDEAARRGEPHDDHVDDDHLGDDRSLGRRSPG
jgi:hypothetical protein